MDWEANTKEAVNFGRFGCVEPTERDMGCADAWARDAPISVREREMGCANALGRDASISVRDLYINLVIRSCITNFLYANLVGAVYP